MVLLDYPFAEAEAKSPSALLGGEAGFEYFIDILAADALAGIGNIDKDAVGVLLDLDTDLSFSFHGIECVL